MKAEKCQALVGELTDAMLETPEPHRSTLLKKLLPLRERIKALRVEE